jgi:FAD/FMN-containing dehydrogenase
MPYSTAPVDPFLEDSSGYRGSAERVAVPATVEEVREIVLACASTNTPLTVSGAGTGLTGARVPQGGWVVSLERFRSIGIDSGRARCGAAVSLADLQVEASKSGQFFGPNPTEISASVGGVIATNAGGARSFHYGSVRRHVLAAQATFMDGRTVELKRGDRVDFPVRAVSVPNVTKNAAGYFLQPDLEWLDLLAGSEGTLAVITEAELRLIPEPAAILSGVVFFRNDADAFDAVDAWRGIGELRLLEFLDEAALNLLRGSYPEIPAGAGSALLVEQNLLTEDDPEVDAWVDRLEVQQALAEESWFGFRAADRERFRRLRHTLPSMVVDRVRRNGFPKFGTDFAVPLDRNRDLHAYYKKRCDEVFPGQYTVFGHVGDANNHVNLLPETAEHARRGEELIDEFAEHVIALGGTVAAEHGIGKSKTNLLEMMYGPEDIEAMRDVKRRLDPQCLLGRGTIFRA